MIIKCPACGRVDEKEQIANYVDFQGNKVESFKCECNHIITVNVTDYFKGEEEGDKE